MDKEIVGFKFSVLTDDGKEVMFRAQQECDTKMLDETRLLLNIYIACQKPIELPVDKLRGSAVILNYGADAHREGLPFKAERVPSLAHHPAK